MDITRHVVNWLDPTTGARENLDVGLEIGAIAPREGGGLVGAAKGAFIAINPGSSAVEMLAPVEPDVPGNRMNDGKCDRRGRFWAGSMAYDLRPSAAGLYRLNVDCTVDKVLDSVTLSNGLGWSLDDRLMYYVDSTTQRIDMFDFDVESSRLANRRTLVDIPERDGMPDGMAIDAEGCIWVAMWGGGSLRRYTPSGALDLCVRLPVTQVTSCAFGGPDFKDLFVTTASARMTEKERAAQPNAGAVFCFRPGPDGLPPAAFNAPR